MAKMGRPRKTDGKKDAQLSVRIAASLRDQLEAARRTGDGERTLSQEVEMRLRQSFDLDGRITKQFGNHGTYYIFLLIADCIRRIEESCLGSPPRKRWFDDPFTFDEVGKTIAALLDYLKPRGKRVVPKTFPLKLSAAEFPKFVASHVGQVLEIPWDTVSSEGLDRAAAIGRSAAVALKRRLSRSPAADNEKYFDKFMSDWLRTRQEKRK